MIIHINKTKILSWLNDAQPFTGVTAPDRHTFLIDVLDASHDKYSRRFIENTTIGNAVKYYKKYTIGVKVWAERGLCLDTMVSVYLVPTRTLIEELVKEESYEYLY